MNIASLRGCVLLSGLSLLSCQSAQKPRTYTVTQENKSFSQQELTLSVRDQLIIRNDDSQVHNLYSASKGFEFEVQEQKPGEKAVIPLPKEGEMTVRCAIHPRMKLKVKVYK